MNLYKTLMKHCSWMREGDSVSTAVKSLPKNQPNKITKLCTAATAASAAAAIALLCSAQLSSSSVATGISSLSKIVFHCCTRNKNSLAKVGSPFFLLPSKLHIKKWRKKSCASKQPGENCCFASPASSCQRSCCTQGARTASFL